MKNEKLIYVEAFKGVRIMTELKPCPFCGHKITIRNNGLVKLPTANRPAFCFGDYATKWEITCGNCGIPKVIKETHYMFTNYGELKVVDGPDGRDAVIEAWNKRQV